MDHQAFLGNTVEEIAKVKAGIIKAGRPCILGPQAHPEAENAIKEIAESHDAPLIQVIPSKDEVGDNHTTRLEYNGQPIQVELPLIGSYQASNAATAVAAIETLCKSTSFNKSNLITATKVKTGIEETRWPGRLDWVDVKGRKILLDGAHNPASIRELAKYLKSLPRQETTFIVALSSPRDPVTLLDPLLAPSGAEKGQTRVIAVGFTQPEGMPWVTHVTAGTIAHEARQLSVKASIATDIKEAIDMAIAQGDNRIVICGSLYLVADVYRYLCPEKA